MVAASKKMKEKEHQAAKADQALKDQARKLASLEEESYTVGAYQNVVRCRDDRTRRASAKSEREGGERRACCRTTHQCALASL